MKWLFILGGLVVVGIGVGVIHVQSSGDKVDISIDKSRLKQTTDKAVQVGRQVVSEAETSLEQASQQQRYQDPNLQPLNYQGQQPGYAQPQPYPGNQPPPYDSQAYRPQYQSQPPYQQQPPTQYAPQPYAPPQGYQPQPGYPQPQTAPAPQRPGVSGAFGPEGGFR